MRSALSYKALPGPLQAASVGSAAVFVTAPCLVAFIYDNPIVLAGAGAAAVSAGVAAGARRALVQASRFGLWLGILIVAANVVATDRGLTLLVRGPELPVLGSVDVTLEAIAAGGVLALRILVVALAFGVYSACINPDRALLAFRRLAPRSALTTTLATRLVPVAVADGQRLREAGELRGPGAAPVDRRALVRRVVAGSLDRAVDVAATLELRGYAGSGRAGRLTYPRRRSAREGRFLAAGAAMSIAAVAARLGGVGAFESYPGLSMDAGAATLALALALPVAALAPFIRIPAGWRLAVGRTRHV